LNVVASSSSQCGGALTTLPAPDETPLVWAGAPGFDLSGVSLAAGDTCSFSVPVTAESAGNLTAGAAVSATQTTNNVTESDSYGTGAMLTVRPTATPATVTSAFTPSTVTENGTTTWTVQIANPNTSATLTGLRFLVGMPITTAWIAPEAITGNSCGGTGIANRDIDPDTISGPAVLYRDGSLAPGAMCVITVSMSTEGTFSQVPIPVAVISNEGGDSAVSTATLTSLAPPTTPVPDPTPVPEPKPAPQPTPAPSTPPSNTFTHAKPTLARDGTVSETVMLPGTGTVRLRETWRGKLIASVQKTVKTNKTLTIKLVPNAAARRALRAHRAATLKLSVDYTPAGGHTRTAKLTARTPR
jgi:hypothetical protein